MFHLLVDTALVAVAVPLMCWLTHKSDQHWDAAQRILRGSREGER